MSSNDTVAVKPRVCRALWLVAGLAVLAGCLALGVNQCAVQPSQVPVHASTCDGLPGPGGSADLCVHPLPLLPFRVAPGDVGVLSDSGVLAR